MPTYTHKYGLTAGLSSGTVIIQTDPAINPFPSSAGQLSLVSSSAQDKSGGTGAIWVRVWGLYESGSDYLEFNDDIEMDGTDSVTVTSSDYDPTEVFRIFRIRALSTSFTGTASNVGTITASVGGTAIAEIDAGRGSTEAAVWSNGSTYTARLKSWWVTIRQDFGGAAAAKLDLWKREFGGPWIGLDPGYVSTAGSGFHQTEYQGLGKLIPKNTDVKLEATRITGTMDLSGNMEIRRTPQPQHQ